MNNVVNSILQARRDLGLGFSSRLRKLAAHPKTMAKIKNLPDVVGHMNEHPDYTDFSLISYELVEAPIVEVGDLIGLDELNNFLFRVKLFDKEV